MIQGLALVFAVFALPAAAHDLWLEKVGAGHALHQGHRHVGHAGAKRVPYHPGAVKSALCLDSAGNVRALVPGKTYPVRFSGDCAALQVSFSSGYWSKTAWETKNLPKTGLAGVMKSWLSEESVKRIEGWNAATAQPLGSGLEITPLADPAKLAVGDKLLVLVTENRKPRPGVPVAIQGGSRGNTGDDGRIALRIGRAGTQIITAGAESPLSDGKADSLIRAATLQFEVRR